VGLDVLVQVRGIIVGSELGDLAVYIETDNEIVFVVELLACNCNQQKPSVVQQSERKSATL